MGKRIGKVILWGGLAILLVFFTYPVGAEEAELSTPPEETSELNLGFEADFVSQYVWRGIALSEGPVLQPSLWLSLYGMTFSIWGNFVLNDEPNQGQLNEVDFTLEYQYRYKRLIVEPGLLFYLYPHQGVPATAEGSFTLGVELGPFTLLTNQFFDFLATPGAYFGTVGGSFEKSLRPKLSLHSALAFGWANGKFIEANFEVPGFAAYLLDFDLDLTWYFRDPFYLRPHLKVSVLLDETLRQSVEDSTLVSGGLAFGMEF